MQYKVNYDYTFPIKSTGPANCINDGSYYGTIKWTWNFDIHWPIVTLDYAEGQTGKNLLAGAGSTALANAELLRIAKIQRMTLMKKIPLVAKSNLEYLVAHNEDLMNDLSLGQLEILQSWGGYNSLYRITDSTNQQSIGKAAMLYHDSLGIYTTYYMWKIPVDMYRVGY